MSEEQPSLGQLIWLVRRELEWAHAVDADHRLRFDVGSVELDVAVEVSRTTSGTGGLDLKVLGVGVAGDVGRESSRGSSTRIHVVLTPRDTSSPDGKFDVSAKDIEPPPRRAAQADTDSAPVTPAGLPHSDGSGLSASDNESSPKR